MNSEIGEWALENASERVDNHTVTFGSLWLTYKSSRHEILWWHKSTCTPIKFIGTREEIDAFALDHEARVVPFPSDVAITHILKCRQGEWTHVDEFDRKSS